MKLSDKNKEILRNHLVRVKTESHTQAVELFKSNDFNSMKNNDFIRGDCRGVILEDELSIEDIQDAYNTFVSSLDSNERVKSYSVYGDEDGINIDFVVYIITHDIESTVDCSFNHIVRDFEFKYVHQRNGNDVVNRLEYFDRIGIDTRKLN